MDSSIKHAIINGSTGDGWYPLGTDRLERSLIYHGFNGDFIKHYNWPNDIYDKSVKYNIKAAIFGEVPISYTHVLWLDCSVWAIKDPNPIFDVINEKGYYFWSSGYNCAQTCSDKCLKYFNVSRDEAELMTDVSTSMFGINYNHPLGKEFINRWLKSAWDGQFGGSRLHDNQSQDTRFLFHRQDQSCASIIANQLKMEITPPGVLSEYYNESPSKSTIFLMRGI